MDELLSGEISIHTFILYLKKGAGERLHVQYSTVPAELTSRINTNNQNLDLLSHTTLV